MIDFENNPAIGQSWEGTQYGIGNNERNV